jgi:uncharacterized membrane protein
LSLTIALYLLGGFILFIVPGILFALWYMVAIPAAIDQNLDTNAAMRESKRLTEGKRLYLFGLVILYIIVYSLLSEIDVLGPIITLVLGMFQTLALAHIYFGLQREKSHKPAAEPALDKA